MIAHANMPNFCQQHDALRGHHLLFIVTLFGGVLLSLGGSYLTLGISDHTIYFWMMFLGGSAITATAALKVYLISRKTEVTRQRVAERARELEESVERFRLITENMSDWIWEINSQGVFTSCIGNPQPVFGYSPEEIVGTNVFDHVSADDLPGFKKNIRKVMAAGSHFKNLEHWVVTKAGKRICLSSNGVPVLDQVGKLLGFRGATKDITDKKTAEEEMKKAIAAAQAANEAKSSFLASMSHEIRTPMNAVVGMSGLLMEMNLTQEQREYAELIQKSANSLLTVINDILDFSKIEAGKLELEVIDFNLRAMLEDVCDILASRIRDKKLEFVSFIDPRIPALLYGDPNRIRQVLTNLLGNALKFTEEGEVALQVKLLEKDENGRVTLRFIVKDTGIGIPREKIPLLFQPFSQAGCSVTARYGGTGLGLSITKQLLELMNGEVEVESEAGKGTTCTVTLPLHEPGEIVEYLDPHEIAEALRESPILSVDDNETNRKVLARMLDYWKCSHDEAGSALGALEKLQVAARAGKPFRIAILDMVMPEIDGLTLGKMIKEDSLIRDTQLIMMSSIGKLIDAGKIKEIGFAAYLTKPVKHSQLYDCLLQLVGRKQVLPSHATPSAGYGLSAVTGKQAQSFSKQTAAVQSCKDIYILVAEDNPTGRKLALKLLENAGYRADGVGDGEAALDALENKHYDLVLMDVQMPIMDGLAATRKIRDQENKAKEPAKKGNQPVNRSIPIIAMTAGAMSGDKEKCLQAGMNDYVTKPINPTLFYQTIKRWLCV